MYKVDEIRTEKGISKNMLCYKAGVTMHTLLKLDKGESVKVSTLLKIADALDVSIKDLFE